MHLPSELKQLRFCAKRELAYKKNKWTLSAVSFSPYSLLSMVEGGWLKMPPKRKFRELKTADEEKALLEKYFPKSTRYVTKRSFNIFAQWQNARLNKQAVKEEAGFDVERDKIQSLDTNIVNMTEESLNFWLTKFVEEVCKEDGERYPHWNTEFTVCGSVLFICDFL